MPGPRKRRLQIAGFTFRERATRNPEHNPLASEALTASASLIAALRNPRCYAHAVAQVEVVETHASWILLTGEHAYKIKKPVNLGFLDYSTLERRRLACEAELRLNRVVAPELYLQIVPVSGPAHAPTVDGDGPALEYAVHMRQFDRDQQLDRLLEAGRLGEPELDGVADYVAAFHLAAPRAGRDAAYGVPQTVHKTVRANLQALARQLAGRRRAQIGRLRVWSDTEYARHRALMELRRAQGWVREGHGDLHLANLTVYRGKLLAFDRIEFDAALRWVDVMSDTAFLVMDLLHHGRRDLAFRFLNRYLEHTGDYRGVPLLRYHLAYRALVRAKVAWLKAAQMQNAESRGVQQRDADRYIELADSLRVDVPTQLVLMHGLSGSGKTRASGQLMTRLPALRLRSDVERKRLHGLASGQRSGSVPGGQLYDETANARTYTQLATLAQIVLAAGYSVIVDAAFLRQWQRRLFAELAARLMIPWSIVECHAPQAVLRRRLDNRSRMDDEISEATAAVLDYQLATADPLDADERRHALAVDSGAPFDAAALTAMIRAAAGMR